MSKYAVYAKVFGAGVALILNKTASEYPGTYVRRHERQKSCINVVDFL